MKYYGITDRGLVRKNNQDSYVIATNKANDVFAIVADGIGGNSGGDIASAMTVSLFSQAFSETEGFTDGQQASQWIKRMITHVNYEIYSYARKRCTQYIKIRIDRIFQGVLPDDAEEDFIAQDVSKSHSRENRDQTHDPSNEAEKI